MSTDTEEQQAQDGTNSSTAEPRKLDKLMEFERLRTSWYFAWQWFRMNGSVVFNGLIVAAMIIQILIYMGMKNIMHQQSDILNKSIQEAIRTREIENRAYINATGGKVKSPVGVGIQGVVELDFRNAGRIPAYYVDQNVDCRFIIRIRTNIPPPPICSPLRSDRGASVIAPGTVEFIGVVLPPLTKPQKDLWDNGAMHVVISGYVFYWDDFRIRDDQPFPEPRRDPFCVTVSSDSSDSLKPCIREDWKYASLMYDYRR